MLPPATWYPDPSGRHEHRYWDGERWTEHVADGGIAALDPLVVVTADAQVDGGLAADMAAVALAATSTAGTTESVEAGGDDRDLGEDPPSGDDGDRPDGVRDDDGLWTTPGSVFIMPPDTAASLPSAGTGQHDAPAGPAGPEGSDGVDGGAEPDADRPRPTFLGLDEPPLSAAATSSGRTLTVALDLEGEGCTAADASLRRIVGTCDLGHTTPPWARRLSGEAVVTLVAEHDTVVVGLRHTDRATVTVDAVVALDGAGSATTVAIDGALAWPLLTVDGADWIALSTSTRLVAVDVHDTPRSVPRADVVAWTGGVVAAPDADHVALSGRGQVLLRVRGR